MQKLKHDKKLKSYLMIYELANFAFALSLKQRYELFHLFKNADKKFDTSESSDFPNFVQKTKRNLKLIFSA